MTTLETLKNLEEETKGATFSGNTIVMNKKCPFKDLYCYDQCEAFVHISKFPINSGMTHCKIINALEKLANNG